MMGGKNKKNLKSKDKSKFTASNYLNKSPAVNGGKRKSSEHALEIAPSKKPKSDLGVAVLHSSCTDAIAETSASAKITFPLLQDLKDRFQDVLQSSKNRQEIEVPDNVNIMKFVECRASEIAIIRKEIELKKPKQTLQQLPHHMRRRAASHNPNRVPRRLREKAIREISKAKKTKCPSRRHRRRPSNLLADYQRRSKANIWLETHIWFTKRFKMEKLWGYYIPIHPNDKNRRSAYKSAKQHAMLQDLSYLCCIELQGHASVLLSKLNQLTEPSTGLTFASVVYRSGKREGNTVLYHPDSFPFRAIGPVTFIWQPLKVGEGHADEVLLNQKLWIWCHPLMQEELLEVLKDIFSLSDVSSSRERIVGDPESEQNVETKMKSLVDIAAESKLLDKKFHNKFKKCTHFFGNGVELFLLKDNLVRYRLIGPKSQSIISTVLKAADLCTHQTGMLDDTKWWEEYFSDEISLNVVQNQKMFWENMEKAVSPSELPSRIVLGFTVRDPRLSLPPRRTTLQKCNGDFGASFCPISHPIPDFLAQSPVWDNAVRNCVTATKKTEGELNKLRSQFLVPGSPLELGREESRVPVLIIQQPDAQGFGSGWDLVAPLGWGMAFWMAFTYHGARAFGLRELKSLSRDLGQPMLPHNYPDTKVGDISQEENRFKMMEKHFRYPPAKRPSFPKLGIQNPFFMPWKTLVNEYVEGMVPTVDAIVKPIDFYVLRNKCVINQLNEVCDFIRKFSMQRSARNKRDKMAQCFEEMKTMQSLQGSIVCIKLESLYKGNIFAYSGVYLLNDSDIFELKRSLKYPGPVELIHRISKNTCGELSRGNRKKKAKTRDVDQLKQLKIEKLKCPVVTNSSAYCTRKLIGYVECGGYSYNNGCGYGMGHSVAIPLINSLKVCLQSCLPPLVLVRSQNSLQYRLARFDINMQI